jgi:glycosyltransferase involved in cell wall biosynthesis
MKKLLILNTGDRFESSGGIAPFMRHMHNYLAQEYEVEYMFTPKWMEKIPGPGRLHYFIYLIFARHRFKKFDFLLSHAVEGSYFASFSKIPYSHIYHGNSNPVEYSRFWYGHYFVKFYDMMFRRIERTAALLYTVGPIRNERQKKLYNPLEQTTLPKPIADRSGFVFAGRIDIVKRVDRLIQNYAKLPADVKDKNGFSIIGSGKLDNEMKALVVQLKESERIKFSGQIDNSLMMPTISKHKIMLMASITEGFPTAIAESLSVGVPVVTTNVGDISSIIKDGYNGRLLNVDFTDEEYIAAILDVLSNYGEMSENAYKTSTVFNCERITNMIIQDINKIIEG